MFGLRRPNRAQSLAEYAILLALVLGAFITMQTYVKRGINASLEATIDEFGPQEEPNHLGSQQEDPAKGLIDFSDQYISSVPKEERVSLNEGATEKILPQDKLTTGARAELPAELRQKVEGFLSGVMADSPLEIKSASDLEAKYPVDEYNTTRSISRSVYDQGARKLE